MSGDFFSGINEPKDEEPLVFNNWEDLCEWAEALKKPCIITQNITIGAIEK